MNRAKFLKNLAGTAGAVVLAPLLPVPKPASISTQFAVAGTTTGRWMSHQTYLFHKQWMEDQEKVVFGRMIEGPADCSCKGGNHG